MLPAVFARSLVVRPARFRGLSVPGLLCRQVKEWEQQLKEALKTAASAKDDSSDKQILSLRSRYRPQRPHTSWLTVLAWTILQHPRWFCKSHPIGPSACCRQRCGSGKEPCLPASALIHAHVSRAPSAAKCSPCGSTRFTSPSTRSARFCCRCARSLCHCAAGSRCIRCGDAVRAVHNAIRTERRPEQVRLIAPCCCAVPRVLTEGCARVFRHKRVKKFFRNFLHDAKRFYDEMLAGARCCLHRDVPASLMCPRVQRTSSSHAS